MNTSESKPEPAAPGNMPTWYFVLSILALLWNLMGLMAFGMTMAMPTDEATLLEAGFTAAQIELLQATPLWVNIAFGVAVIGGVIGSVLLVMKRRIALLAIVLSLLGVVPQQIYIFFLSNTVQVMGIGLTPIILVVAIALIPFAILGRNKQYLR
ncbi:MAG: hypothetical protein AAFP69_04540 [Planctomycetota bacterium]